VRGQYKNTDGVVLEIVVVPGLVEIERRCAEHNLRLTGQRRTVLRVIAEARIIPIPTSCIVAPGY
jgi:hypothetical protein